MIKCSACDKWATHIFHAEYQVRTDPPSTPIPGNPHVVAVPAVLCYKTVKSQTAVCDDHLGKMIDSFASWGKHAKYRIEDIREQHQK